MESLQRPFNNSQGQHPIFSQPGLRTAGHVVIQVFGHRDIPVVDSQVASWSTRLAFATAFPCPARIVGTDSNIVTGLLVIEVDCHWQLFQEAFAGYSYWCVSEVEAIGG
jgi:hypothetical protein